MTRSGGRLVPWLLALAGYISLTLVCTWPLPLRLATAIPHDAGDPLLTAWILAWNAHTVPLTATWWNAPMFWPMPGALGLSEHMLGLSLVASPLQWLGTDPIVAYNVLFLLSFPLCAIAAHALAHTVTERHDAATLAGVVFAFNPYRLSQVSHLHILWVFWMPLALMALHRYARDGRGRWLALFVAMWIGQALSNGYFLLFFPILVAMWIAWFIVSRRNLRRLGAVAAAWGVGTMVLLPVVLPYSHLQDRFALERGIAEIRLFSADVTALGSASLLVPTSTLLPSVGNAEQQLFPGVTVVIVILAAAVVSLRRAAAPSRWPRVSTAFASIACLAIAAALTARLGGPWRISLGGRTLVSVTTIAKPVTVALWCVVLVVAASARFWRANRAFRVRLLLRRRDGHDACSASDPDPTFLGVPFWAQQTAVRLAHGASRILQRSRAGALRDGCRIVPVGGGGDRVCPHPSAVVPAVLHRLGDRGSRGGGR